MADVVQQAAVDLDIELEFSRNADGSLNWKDAPIFNELAADPELGRLRLIAEPWDTGAYQLGRGFPGVTWHQWNGRFRDDIRRFVKGDPGMVPNLMHRIYGSDDLFPDSLAEAYTDHGDRDLAIQNYRKSLELNPNNANGVKMLEKLSAQ